MGAGDRLGVKGVLVAAVVVSLGTGGCGGSNTDSSKATLQISAPQDGGTVRTDRVTVRGTVTPSDATVQILGQSAQVGNGVFTGSVPLHRGSNTIDIVASATGSAPVTTTITVSRLGPGTRKLKIRAKRAPPLSGPRNCGNGLTVGANTSCPFAENVREAYSASGSGILDVYSPTTGQTYRMYCTSGSPHVCTGGNGASVYFSSGGAVTGYTVSDCGGGLTVGPNTSCPFAENVQAKYYRSGPGWIDVYSPVTGRTYRMYCTSGSPHVCTGGNDAAVYFP
jgi:glucodextranase-like protein